MMRWVKNILPAKIAENVSFLKNYHRLIDWREPRLMDEKLLILKSGKYKKNPLIKKCTDKYLAREYVSSKIGGGYCIRLYAVYDNARDILWQELPERYVIKCNHGCGYNIIVDHVLSKAETKNYFSRLKGWMNTDYGWISGEYHYRGIQRKILVEEYIGTEDFLPADYKFFCSRGKIICILIIIGRGGKEKWLFTDKNFKNLNFVQGTQAYFGDVKKIMPKHYAELCSIAERLSADFPFVRVDLYDTEEQPYFGELTFTPHGSIHSYLSVQAQKWIGDQICL